MSVTMPTRTSPSIILAIGLSIFAIAPLFYPGYLQLHSGFIPIWNVADLRANWGDWQWLPHTATTFNPLTDDGLLPYYLAALLPVTPTVSVKMVVGLGWLLGVVGLTLWLKPLLGPTGSLIAGMVYGYLPHQISTAYIRGAWGETLFWGLLPWAMFGAISLTDKSSWRYSPLMSLLWLGLGLSHWGLSLWAFLLMSLFLMLCYPKQAMLPLLGAAIGLAIVSWPMRSFPLNGSADLTAHLLYPAQLFSAYWGPGISQPSWQDGLSLQLGFAALGLAALSINAWYHSTINNPRLNRLMIFFSIMAIGLTLLQLTLAAPLWELPPLQGGLAIGLRWPWQLMGFVGLALAILAGAATQWDEQLAQLPLVATLIIFIILSSFSYLNPTFIQPQFIPTHASAAYGANDLLLLQHEFAVVTNGNSAGMNPLPASIPLAVHGPLTAHDTLRVDVTWQPLQPLDQDWKLFIHLVDAADNVIAQFDGYPPFDRPDRHRTSQWIPGALITDRYPLTLPANPPPAPHRLFIGFYDEATFARLPVSTDAEGRVILTVE